MPRDIWGNTNHNVSLDTGQSDIRVCLTAHTLNTLDKDWNKPDKCGRKGQQSDCRCSKIRSHSKDLFMQVYSVGTVIQLNKALMT